jgi:hypothetical protein
MFEALCSYCQIFLLVTGAIAIFDEVTSDEIN